MTVVAGWWGGNDDVEGATQSVIKRGGDAGREEAIHTSWRKRDGGATREEAMQQPTRTREVQREERDGGATREGRGGTTRGCTGSTTKGDVAQQQVI